MIFSQRYLTIVYMHVAREILLVTIQEVYGSNFINLAFLWRITVLKIRFESCGWP